MPEKPSPFKEEEGKEKNLESRKNSTQEKCKDSHILLIFKLNFQEKKGEEENRGGGKVFTRSVFQGGNSFEERGSRCKEKEKRRQAAQA